MVEFALVLPLLLLIVVGVFDLGWAVYAQNTLALATREGARVGVVEPSDSVIVQAVIARATGLGLDSTRVHVCYGTTTLCTANAGTRLKGSPIAVSATYMYTPLTPLIGSVVGVGGGLLLQSQAIMVVECTLCN